MNLCPDLGCPECNKMKRLYAEGASTRKDENIVRRDGLPDGAPFGKGGGGGARGGSCRVPGEVWTLEPSGRGGGGSGATCDDQPDDLTEHVAKAIWDSRHQDKWEVLMVSARQGSRAEKYRKIARVAIAAMPKRESIKGFYVCTHCNNTELKEREVTCWRCGFGDMVYRKIELLPLEQDDDRRKPPEEKP